MGYILRESSQNKKGKKLYIYIYYLNKVLLDNWWGYDLMYCRSHVSQRSWLIRSIEVTLPRGNRFSTDADRAN